MFNYWIVYYYRQDTSIGIGTCAMSTSEKIKSEEQIIEISNEIKEKVRFNELVIINWKLFN